MRALTPMLLSLIIVEAGCARPPATARAEVEPRPTAAEAMPGPASGGVLEGTSPRLTIAPLEMVPVGESSSLLTLKADGSVSVGDTPLGTLRAEGRFTFAADERVAATLDEDGAVSITGPQDIRRDLPGSLSRDLQSFQGRIRSAFLIDEQGDARGGGLELQLLPGGKTSDGRLVVIGLTPSTRRTAMFMIILLSMIVG